MHLSSILRLKPYRAALAALTVGLMVAAISGYGSPRATAGETSADLRVTKTADLDVARVGDLINYSIRIKNLGPHSASDVVIGEDAPDELGVESFECNEGTHVPQFAFACSYDEIEVGDTVFMSFVGRVTSDARPREEIVNSAFVAESGTSDPRVGNNEDSAVVHVVRPIRVRPRVVDFGEQPFESFTKKRFNIRNLSSETVFVTIRSIEMPDDFSPGQPESTCPLEGIEVNELSPQERCHHVVGFQPAEVFEQPESARMRVVAKDEHGNRLGFIRVLLRGEGAEP